MSAAAAAPASGHSLASRKSSHMLSMVVKMAGKTSRVPATYDVAKGAEKRTSAVHIAGGFLVVLNSYTP